jgi:hypothetical protein
LAFGLLYWRLFLFHYKQPKKWTARIASSRKQQEVQSAVWK